MIQIPAFPETLSYVLLWLPALPLVFFGFFLMLDAESDGDRVIPAGMTVYGLLMCWAAVSLLVTA